MKKPTYIYLTIICVLTSCVFFTTATWTKEGTIKAALGKWRHVDVARTDVKSIEFKINEKGDSVLIWEFKKKNTKGDVFDKGVWSYKNPGEIGISDIDKTYTLQIKLHNAKNLELELEDMYVKEQ